MVTLIIGCMFAGKTDTLHTKLNRDCFGKRSVYLTTKDTRHGGDSVTHSGTPVSDKVILVSLEWLVDNAHLLNNTTVGIDEIQFIDTTVLIPLIRKLSTKNRVFLAGLDQDYLGESFETSIRAVSESDKIIRCKACCDKCGADAIRTHRITDSTDRILEGAKESYITLCKECRGF